MRRFRKGQEKIVSQAAQEAGQMLDALQARIVRNWEADQWGAVDDDSVRVMQLLRESSGVAPATQSLLAALHARWGLTQVAQRRHEEAHKHLAIAEALFNMELESAVEWAEAQGIAVDRAGDPLDLGLALAALKALADGLLRLGAPETQRVLAQVVEVAGMASDEGEQWEAHRRLVAFTAGLADWPGLVETGRAMGRFAREQRSLPYLLEALRALGEALFALEEGEQAREAQRLVVDIARYLDHPSVQEEEDVLRGLVGTSP